MTPYAAAKIATQRLSDEGLAPKQVRPQMMYNYTIAKLNAGEKPLIKFSIEDGVDVTDFNRWLDQYVAKQLAKAGKVVEVADPEQAEFDEAEAH